MAEAGSGRTDWNALADLDEVRISVRALEDPDTILPTPEELSAGSAVPAVRFEVHRLASGEYGWRLTSAEGTDFAVSPGGFATRQDAIASVRAFLQALGRVSHLAA